MDDKLKSYIAACRAENLSDEQIESKLVAAGWSQALIDKALKQTRTLQVSVAPTPSTPMATNNNMWDSFEHILLFINLYILSISMTMMIHVIVDHYYPAPSLNNSTDYYGGVLSFFSKYFISYYLAGIIVSYPIFSALFLQITKRTIVKPELRQLKSRRILTYLTLIITFLILIGQLISLVINFINGNTSLNFFLHLFTTVTISGAIFSYYYYQVKHDRDALMY